MPKRIEPQPLPIEPRRIANFLVRARREMPAGVNRELVLRRALQLVSHDVATSVGARVPRTPALSQFEAYHDQLYDLAWPLDRNQPILNAHRKGLIRLCLSMQKELNALSNTPFKGLYSSFVTMPEVIHERVTRDPSIDPDFHVDVSSIKPSFNMLDKIHFQTGNQREDSLWLEGRFNDLGSAVNHLVFMHHGYIPRKSRYGKALDLALKAHENIVNRHLGGRYADYRFEMDRLKMDLMNRQLRYEAARAKKNP